VAKHAIAFRNSAGLRLMGCLEFPTATAYIITAVVSGQWSRKWTRLGLLATDR
jgi:hypothetical protein